MKKDLIVEKTIWLSKAQMEEISFPYMEFGRRDDLDHSSLFVRLNRQGYLLLKALLDGVKVDDF